MEFIKCLNCKDYHWDTEQCKPAYTVYFPEYLGDDGKVVRARSFEEAAENFADYYNSNGDYPMMDGEPIEVTVEYGDQKRIFTVTAIPSIDYSVDEKQP